MEPAAFSSQSQANAGNIEDCYRKAEKAQKKTVNRLCLINQIALRYMCSQTSKFVVIHQQNVMFTLPV